MTEPPNGWVAPAESAAPPWQPPTAWGAPPPPEAQPGVIPLRPLGLGELLDGAVGLIRRYPRPVLGLSAALAVVSTVLNVTLAVTAFRPLLALDSTAFTPAAGSTGQLDGVIGGAVVGSLGSGLVSALATLVLTGVLTAIAGRGVLGEPMTLAQAWAQVRPALGRLLGIALVTGVVVYGAVTAGVLVAVLLVAGLGTTAALIGVPVGLGAVCLAVYLYCRLALAPCAAVLERAGVRTSLRRSGVLVRRSWWRVFGVLALSFVVAAVVGQVLQVPFLLFGIAPIGGLRGSGEATTRLLVLGYIGAGISQTVVAPFTAGVRALLYVDRRMRAEGLDLALTAAAAAQRST